jgi:alkylation response protein AidB-like acyl-CoA dehydrogenase
MSLELTARTEAGGRLIALAETLAREVGTHASDHDREATFPFESLAVVKQSGYLAAPAPEELGGLGVTSVHDLLVASSRLARGDAALTLGVNMHLVFVLNVSRRLRIAIAAGNERRARALRETLEEIARERLVFAAAGSEPRQDLTRPTTTARRTESGWIVDGHKVFCTMAPAADLFYTAVTFTDDSGGERYGYAMVPRQASGVVVHDDWDALGMRASGSNSVSFQDVRIPLSALQGGFPTGDAVEYMERNLTAGLFHAAAALGIAESAHASASATLARRTEIDPHAQMLAAQSAVDLSAARALFSRSAALIDEHQERNPTSRGTAEELTRLFGEAQAAKLFVGDAAVQIVDRALALSGGSGYRNGSPLARSYRDVRAIPFMHPLGANRAYAFLGQLAADREPNLH